MGTSQLTQEGYQAVPKRSNSQNSHIPVWFGELIVPMSETMLT